MRLVASCVVLLALCTIYVDGQLVLNVVPVTNHLYGLSWNDLAGVNVTLFNVDAFTEGAWGVRMSVGNGELHTLLRAPDLDENAVLRVRAAVGGPAPEIFSNTVNLNATVPEFAAGVWPGPVVKEFSSGKVVVYWLAHPDRQNGTNYVVHARNVTGNSEPLYTTTDDGEGMLHAVLLPDITPAEVLHYSIKAENLLQSRTHAANVTSETTLATSDIVSDIARTQVLDAIADTYSHLGVSHGTNMLLRLEKGELPDESSVAYVKFDIDSLDKKCVVESATIVLCFQEAAFGSMRVYSSLTSTWSENDASFPNPPPIPTQWELPLAVHHPVTSPYIEVYEMGLPVNKTRIPLDYVAGQAADVIQEWKKAPATNNGFMLFYEDSQPRSFFSRESVLPQMRPQLEIECKIVSPPTAVDDDAGMVDEDSVLTTTDVRENDFDPDGDSLEVIAFDVTSLHGAAISYNGDGTFQYDPTGVAALQALKIGEFQPDEFKYTIDDGTFRNDTATVFVNVTGENDAPVAMDDSGAGFATDEDTARVLGSVLANDIDVDGDILSVQSVDVLSSQGASVSVLGNGSIFYDPTAAVALQQMDQGDALLDTFQYVVQDVNGATSDATVTVSVTGLNDRPDIDDSSAIQLSSQMEDDLNPSGDDLVSLLSSQVTDVDQASTMGIAVISLDSSNGAWEYSLNGGGSWIPFPLSLSVAEAVVISDSALNRVRFVPVADFVGSSTMSVKAWDTTNGLPDGTSAVDTLDASATSPFSTTVAVIEATVTNVPDDPVAVDDFYGIVTEGTTLVLSPSVVANDTDADDSDVLSLDSVASTSVMGASVSVAGSITYDATSNTIAMLADGEMAVDTFTYTVTDLTARTAVGTVHITLVGVNSAPLAVDDSDSTDEETAIMVDVLSNDSDPDNGDTIAITLFDGTSALGASVTTIDSSTLMYDPNGAPTLIALQQGSSLMDTFTYTIEDAAGLQSTATVTILVMGVNTPPVAVPDSTTDMEDLVMGKLFSTFTANDVDPESEALTIVSVDPVSFRGAAVSISMGLLFYDAVGAVNLQSLPDGGSIVDTFQYVVADPQGATATATISTTVSGANDAPVIDNSGQPTIPAVAMNDFDPPGSTVGAIIDSMASYFDVDAGSVRGLAVIGVDDTDGQWQYAISPGVWNPIGARSVVSALLLPDSPSVEVRFVPNPSFQGSATFDVRGWDQTQGTAGGIGDASIFGFVTPYSIETETVSVNVIDTNFRPELTPTGTATFTAIDEDVLAASNGGDSVDQLFAQLTVTDMDSPSLDGLAITALDESNGRWQFTKNGGAFWQNVGTVSGASALLLASTASNGLRFVPNANYFGVSSVVVKAWDQTEGSNGAFLDTTGTTAFSTESDTITVTINSVNDPPVAVDDFGPGFATLASQSVLTPSVLTNDFDVDMDPLSVSAFSATSAQGALVAMGVAGRFSYSPLGSTNLIALGAGAVVTDTFTYTVTDQTDTDDGVVSIVVTGVNDPVIATDDITSAFAVGATPFDDLLVNDVDLDIGDVLFIQSADSLSSEGASITIVGPTSVMYDAASSSAAQSLGEGATLNDFFTYTVSDGEFVDTATVMVVVTGLNDNVIAVDDAFTANEDDPVLLDVVANDMDPDIGDVPELSAVDALSSLGATLSISGGEVLYDPTSSSVLNSLAIGEEMIDTFSYEVSDGAVSQTFDNGLVTMTVSGRNDDVVAFSNGGSGFITAANQILITATVLGNDVDPDSSDVLSLIGVNPSSTKGASTSVHSASMGTIVYDPRLVPQFVALGAGQQTTDDVLYTCTDGHGSTDTAIVTFTINGINDPPLAEPDEVATDEDTDPVVDVLANDSDPDTLDVPFVQSFDSATSTFGLPVSSLGGGVFMVDVSSSAQINALSEGEVVFDTFQYTISDTRVESVGVVTIEIEGRNDAPSPMDDSGFATNEDTAFDIFSTLLLANDIDVDQMDSVIFDSVDAMSVMGAAVTFIPPSRVQYDPTVSVSLNGLSVGEVVVDQFQYTVTDGLATATATVFVEVSGRNDPVIASDDVSVTLRTDEDSAFNTLNVLLNDVDPDFMDILIVSSFQSTSELGAKISSNGDGTLHYDPTQSGMLQLLAVGETAIDSFTYTVSDTHGSFSSARVFITVDGRDDPVTAVNDGVIEMFVANEDDLFTSASSVLDNDFSDNGDVLSVQSADAVSSKDALVSMDVGGFFTVDASGSSSLNSLALGESAVDEFQYVVVDAGGLANAGTGTVFVTVEGRNDNPVAFDDGGTEFTTDEDSIIVTGSVLLNDVDPDTSDVLTVLRTPSFATALGARVSHSEEGTFTYDATRSSFLNGLSDGELATDSFEYTAVDPHGAHSSPAIVEITVLGVNDAPQAHNDLGAGYSTTSSDSLVTPDLRFNDVDVDRNDVLTVVEMETVSVHGATIVDNGDGTATYNPQGAAAFQGLLVTEVVDDSFQYVVTDGFLNSTATVIIRVYGTKLPMNPQTDPTPTATATATATPTPTPTSTPTPTPTTEVVAVSTPTSTPSAAPEATPTATPTVEPISTFAPIDPVSVPIDLDPLEPELTVLQFENVQVSIPSGSAMRANVLVFSETPLSVVMSASNSNDIRSRPITIVLRDSDQNEIQPDGNIEICFDVNDRAEDTRHRCLGFLDESLEPPEWVCEDKCLKEDGGKLCGETSHFTSFAVLFSGSGGTDGECDSGAQYIFGAVEFDIVLIMSVTGAVVLCAIIFVLIASIPRVQMKLHGAEFSRIRLMRNPSQVDARPDEVDLSLADHD